jgi:hypothetical protein
MLVSQLAYPGITAVLSAEAVDVQGVTPGRVTIQCPAPLGTIAPVGDLIFGDGVNPPVTWPGCRVAHVSYSGGSGIKPTATILLEDRRYQWATGEISGRYNVPAEWTNTVPLVPPPGVANLDNQNFVQVPIPPGEEPIRPETAKNARQLCELCLKAMGETRYDVSAIDPKAYPSVEWDSEVPARALQSLAERFGCRVVYRKDTDSVLVAKEGSGGPLPDGPLLFESPSLSPKAVPKWAVVRSAFIRYQMRFFLEAVGLEFDGAWRPIDDLSYRPKDGWQSIGLAFGNLTPAILPPLPGDRTFRDAVALASAYIYRAYRVKLTRTDGKGVLRIPVNGGEKDRVDFHKQIYLLPNKAQVTQDDLRRRSPAPAQVFGRHTRLYNCGALNPVKDYDGTTPQTEVVMPFSIDPEHAVIIFAQPVFALKAVPPADGGDGTKRAYYPAEIVLETACHFAPKDNWQFRRRDFKLAIPGGLSDLPLYVVREQLLATSVASYDRNNNLNKITDNDKDLNGRANYYLQGELLKLLPAAAETRTYSGIVAVYPDGAIEQVTAAIAAGDRTKPSTTASLHEEHSGYQPNYEGRRLREEADLRPQVRQQEQRAKDERSRKGDGGGGL